MKTAKEIAQWVIDNRYPKSKKKKFQTWKCIINL